MEYKFLDLIGLRYIVNKIKETFVPKKRKIANIDLQDDISAEELGNNLKDYVDGKSAYEVAVDNGFVGSEQLWLESLKGDDAYELAQQNGFSGTKEEWLESLKGKSVTHSWDGTILTITSASGTTSSDLKGEKGEKGTSVTDGMMVEDDNIGNVTMTWLDYEDGNGVAY